MAQGRQVMTQAERNASNIADNLQIKALEQYSRNGATKQEKMQCDFLVLRIQARIAARSNSPKSHGTLVSVFGVPSTEAK